MILSMHTQAVSISSYSLFHLLSDPSLFESVAKPIPACMAESARLYGPCSITKTVLEKQVTAGFKFSPGMTLFVSPTSVHLDEKVVL